MPGDSDVGEYANIVVSVRDPQSVISLPNFSITVSTDPAPVDPGDSASAPPTISGSPNQSAIIDSLYSFQPMTSDPDGDALSFSVVNKPRWATFDTTTGRLEGEPTSADIGTSDPIEVSVLDGSNVAALNPFAISVDAMGTVSLTLSWAAPTQNEDGSPLTDLAGYRVYYGTSSGSYSEVVEINSPGMNRYVIDNVAPGTYFVVMTSFNSKDLESDYTEEASFSVGS
jgi:hypothetical protein